MISNAVNDCTPQFLSAAGPGSIVTSNSTAPGKIQKSKVMGRGGRQPTLKVVFEISVPFFRGRFYPPVFTPRHSVFATQFQRGLDWVHHLGHCMNQCMMSPEDAHPVFKMDGKPWTAMEISPEGSGFFPFHLPHLNPVLLRTSVLHSLFLMFTSLFE